MIAFVSLGMICRRIQLLRGKQINYGMFLLPPLVLSGLIMFAKVPTEAWGEYISFVTVTGLAVTVMCLYMTTQPRTACLEKKRVLRTCWSVSLFAQWGIISALTLLEPGRTAWTVWRLLLIGSGAALIWCRLECYSAWFHFLALRCASLRFFASVMSYAALELLLPITVSAALGGAHGKLDAANVGLPISNAPGLIISGFWHFMSVGSQWARLETVLGSSVWWGCWSGNILLSLFGTAAFRQLCKRRDVIKEAG